MGLRRNGFMLCQGSEERGEGLKNEGLEHKSSVFVMLRAL